MDVPTLRKVLTGPNISVGRLWRLGLAHLVFLMVWSWHRQSMLGEYPKVDHARRRTGRRVSQQWASKRHKSITPHNKGKRRHNSESENSSR